MLMRVAGENDPALDSLNEREQFQHLLPADLARLIHNNNRPASQEILLEQSTDGLCAGKAVTFQIGDLLALGGEDLHDMTGSVESLFDFPKGKTFARPCAAAKQGDEITRGQDMFDGLTLLIIQ